MSLRALKFAGTRRGLVTLGALGVLLLFLVRPEVNRLRASIVSSISVALGRPVEVSSVSLRLLPQPGFDLENFVVHDDPGISAEPVLRSSQVAATLRVRSLLRGRLEINRLHLSEPSLNLVRGDDGHWNIESLVERAAKTPVAPTGKSQAEPRPGFPYIEASDGRINFKLGHEKKPFVLSNADFTLWQDSEDAWGVRLEAQPTRTDFNLSDTGVLRIEGSWQRAQSLAETPFQMKAQWERAQLGQFTKLVSGDDKGWRGTVLVNLRLSGTPADLDIAGTASVDDFRRYDIMSDTALRLATTCTAHYRAAGALLSDIACKSPVEDGLVSVTGEITHLRKAAAYRLELAARDVPLRGVMAFVQRAKKEIPDDLLAGGELTGGLTVNRGEESGLATWQGRGEIRDLRLVSRSATADVLVSRLPFKVVEGKPAAEPRINIGPLGLDLGAPKQLTAYGWVSRTGYSLQAQGNSRVREVLQLARALGLPSIETAAQGAAHLDLRLEGRWKGFAPPALSGKAVLTALHSNVGGLASPLEVSSATVMLRPEKISVENVTASLGNTTWRGSLTLPRHCETPASCPVEFDLHTKELSAEKLIAAFTPDARNRAWYRFLVSAQPGTSYLSKLNAHGRLSADRVTFRNLSAGQVSADTEIKSGRLQLQDLKADLLGGKQIGDWTMDFGVKPPRYTGKGLLRGIALGQIAEAMNDRWVTGRGSATFELKASGSRADEVLSSLDLTMDAEAQNAFLPHVVLSPELGPLRAPHFEGKLLFRAARLELREGKLETAGGIYSVSGTASRSRTLDIRLLRDGAHGFTVTGSLAAPKVTPATTAETRAALKPE